MNMRYAMRSEDTEQINVVSWANWNMNRYPELKWLHHVPNGGSRNKQEAVKLKQMGVKAGVSDLCLPYPKLFVIKQYEEEINYKMLTDEEQDDGFYYKYNEKVLFRTDSKTQMNT